MWAGLDFVYVAAALCFRRAPCLYSGRCASLGGLVLLLVGACLLRQAASLFRRLVYNYICSI